MIKYKFDYMDMAKPMPKQFFTAFSLCAYFFLMGCGTKGPLYIPEQRYPQQTQEKSPTKAPQNNTNNQPTKE
jgi:predicted small lipoprotein YifL